MSTTPSLPPALGHIPLLPRSRPPVLPPGQRVTELHDLLDKADHAQDTTEGLIIASEVMNKAALLASDTGRPDLAERLCRRHFDLFASAAPLSAENAILALQSLVNLGRLAIRAGQGSLAHKAFDSLLTALTHSRPAFVLGRSYDVAGLVNSDAERARPRRFLWQIALADGTRALCGAGRWQEALIHLERHNGIGRRMLDGRQVAVVAALHDHDHETAHTLLAESIRSEAWEHAVFSCLSAATAHSVGDDLADAAAALTDSVLALPPLPRAEVFAARVGTLACELMPGHDTLFSHLVEGIMGTDDARAAAVVLGSPLVETRLTEAQRRTLNQRIERTAIGGCGQGSSLVTALEMISDRASARLRSNLGRISG